MKNLGLSGSWQDWLWGGPGEEGSAYKCVRHAGGQRLPC